MSSLATINLNDLISTKFGSTSIKRIMHGTLRMWPKLQCINFEVISDIQNASGDYNDVYCTGDSKWYKKNNLSEYEEYGVYEKVSNLNSATYYTGKLVHLTTDDHEYKWNGSSWVDLGIIDNSPLPNIPFSLNYNAKNYDSSAKKILMTNGQLQNVDAVCR